jgi:anti-sigma-K factor RskA
LLGIADWGQSTHSWLISGESAACVIGSLLWLVVIIAFCAAVYGLWNQQAWWRNAAIIASIISTVGLIIFWSNPVSSPVVSALVFNLLVLGVLLIAHWPRIEAVGA